MDITAAGAKLPAVSAGLPETTITGDMLDRFLGFCDVAGKSKQTYKKSLRPFFRWIAARNIARPSRLDVMAYRDDLRATKKPTTTQAYITAVRLFFRWAAGEGLYPDIADHIKGAKLDASHKRDAFTAEQVKSILAAARHDRTITGLRNYALLTLMFSGGLRTIEASRADVSDLRAKGGRPVLFIQGKGHEEKGEFIKLLPPVEMAIREYLGARGAKDGEPLFTSTDNNSAHGRRLSTNSISAIIKRAFIAAGFNSPRLTAHSTRHTAVTLALLGGDTLEEARQFARHKSVQTTLIYAHDLEREANPSEERIAAMIF